MWSEGPSLASLAAATSPQEDMSEGRLLFSNYTSGLLALMPVNSTTYNLVSLLIGGGALVVALLYLLSTSEELSGLGLGNIGSSSQYYSQYRAFNTEFKKMSNGLDLMSLVSGAIKIYSKLNEEDED